MMVYKHTWMVIFSGFFEPLFYLLSVGFGVGHFIGKIDLHGVLVPYAAFIAPGMLANSCFNGAITDGFFNPFFKLNFQKTYDGVLATPLGVPDIALGEIFWAQIRGSIYAVSFLIVMIGFGLILSPWALLAIPAAILTSFAFSSGAMMITSIAKSFHSFDRIMNLVVMPMFLFSGTFFPISLYPAPIEFIVQLTPLYHGVSLLRALTTGVVTPYILIDIAYLLLMATICLTIAFRRLERKLIQ